MIEDIPLAIGRRNGRIIFSFPSGPIGFVTLLVTDTDGDEVWQLHPIGMSAGALECEGTFVATPTDEIGSTFLDLLKPAGDGRELLGLPRCTEVEYGVAPTGYVEIAPALPLEAGGSYSIIVLNARSSAALEFVA
jgi:hypothetical protein